MATIASPQKRSRTRRRWPWIVGALVVVVLIGGVIVRALSGAVPTQGNAATATPGWTTTTAQTGTIDASVSATGSIEPQSQAQLRFAVEGTVTEILVQPGARVEAGQPLARIDDTDLKLGVEQAQATVKQAEADYQSLRTGATPEELARAQAQIAQAQAQYEQVAGSVTRADIAAARSRLDAAKARLASLQAGYTGTRDAELSIQTAQNQLVSQRDQLSLAKTNAERALEQRVNELTRAQSAYSTASQNWQYVQDTGNDPINPTTVNSQGKQIDNKVNDAQRQQYYSAFVEAEAMLRSAESAVQQAQAAYETARQAEITGIQAAEQQVASAQTKLDSQRAGGEAQEIAAARAEVDSAQASLNQLTGANRSGSIAAAQASVDIAKATLAELTADPSATALAKADAALASAQASLKQAQRNLDQATLKAPFAATVARIDLQVGESSSSSGLSASGSATSSGVIVVDLRSFHVDVAVDELDVAQIKPQQPVRITLDALPDMQLSGTVTNIEPLATKNDRGTTTYNVTVTLDAVDGALQPGMTTTVQIVTLKKDNAILVPRRAVQLEDGKSYVLIVKPGPFDPRTNTPSNERREVALGLSNSEMVEITSGLQEGEQIYVQDVVNTFNPVQTGGVD